MTIGASLFLIAAGAIRHHLAVLHDGRDFDTLARVSSLQVRRLKKSPPR